MYYFIVNKVSRSGKAAEIWDELSKIIEESGIEYEVHFTEHKDHSVELAAKINASKKSSEDAIIIVGGDGTINGVLTGLPLNDNPLLGYIPTGSGNDFATGLGFKLDPKEALDRILKKENIRQLDAGQVTYGDGLVRRFGVSGGIGYDASICEEINTSKIKTFCNKLHMGALGFVIIGLKQWLSHPRVKGYLELDGDKKIPFKHASFISVHNVKFEGGGYAFVPGAKPDDGKLGVCLMNARNRFMFFAALGPTKKFEGFHLKIKGVENYSCKELRLKVNKNLTVHTDGEIMGHYNELKFEVIPKAFRIIY